MLTKLATIPGGWTPRFSPDGSRLCFGFGRVGWAPVEQNATARWVRSRGFAYGWRSPFEIFVMDDGTWIYDTVTQWATQLDHVPGNHNDAFINRGVSRANGDLYWNGSLLVTGRLGANVWKEHLVTARNPGTETRWPLEHYVNGELKRTFTAPSMTNEVRMGEHGFIGYLGGNYATPTDPPEFHDTSVVPGEGAPLIFTVGGEHWCVTSCGDFMAVRPLHSRTVIQLPARGVRPVVHVDGQTITVAGADGDTGLLSVFKMSADHPRELVEVPIDVPPVNRAVWMAFYEFVAAVTPGNAELRQVSSWEWTLTHNGKKIAVYVSGEPDGVLSSINANIQRVKGQGVPIIAYWPKKIQEGPLPTGADWIGVELYGSDGSPENTEARGRRVFARCKNVALVAQCYTSNKDNTPDLRGLVPAYARLARDPKVRAILPFSGSGRPTGLQDHPEVLPLWRDLAQSVRTPLIPVPPTPTPPIVLPPTEVPVQPYFPTDAEFAAFYLWLNNKYHTDPKMQPRPLLAKSQDPATFPDVYVDPIGQGRWVGEFYYNCVAKGMNAQQSTAAVEEAIDDILDP